jgi:hypothetical protein
MCKPHHDALFEKFKIVDQHCQRVADKPITAYVRLYTATHNIEN